MAPCVLCCKLWRQHTGDRTQFKCLLSPEVITSNRRKDHQQDFQRRKRFWHEMPFTTSKAVMLIKFSPSDFSLPIKKGSSTWVCTSRYPPDTNVILPPTLTCLLTYLSIPQKLSSILTTHICQIKRQGAEAKAIAKAWQAGILWQKEKGSQVFALSPTVSPSTLAVFPSRPTSRVLHYKEGVNKINQPGVALRLCADYLFPVQTLFPATHSGLSLSFADGLTSHYEAKTFHPRARPLCSGVGVPGPRASAEASLEGHWAVLHMTRWPGVGALGKWE